MLPSLYSTTISKTQAQCRNNSRITFQFSVYRPCPQPLSPYSVYIICFVCICIKGDWTEEFDAESAGKSSWKRLDLARHLRDFLYNKYPDDGWFVIVYGEVSGFEEHTIRGSNGYSKHTIFRHDGHNFAVGRLPGGPSSNAAPANLADSFSKSYNLIKTCTWGSCAANSGATNEKTWNNLKDPLIGNVTPLMLFIADTQYVDNRGGLAYARTHGGMTKHTFFKKDDNWTYIAVVARA